MSTFHFVNIKYLEFKFFFLQLILTSGFRIAHKKNIFFFYVFGF